MGGVRKKARSSGGNKTTNRKKKSFNKRLNKNKNNKVSTLKKSRTQRARTKVSEILKSGGITSANDLYYTGLLDIAFAIHKNKKS